MGYWYENNVKIHAAVSRGRNKDTLPKQGVGGHLSTWGTPSPCCTAPNTKTPTTALNVAIPLIRDLRRHYKTF